MESLGLCSNSLSIRTKFVSAYHKTLSLVAATTYPELYRGNGHDHHNRLTFKALKLDN